MSNFASMETAKTLKGEGLYDYMTLFYNDDDYRKIVELLPIALPAICIRCMMCLNAQ